MQDEQHSDRLKFLPPTLHSLTVAKAGVTDALRIRAFVSYSILRGYRPYRRPSLCLLSRDYSFTISHRSRLLLSDSGFLGRDTGGIPRVSVWKTSL